VWTTWRPENSWPYRDSNSSSTKVMGSFSYISRTLSLIGQRWSLSWTISFRSALFISCSRDNFVKSTNCKYVTHINFILQLFSRNDCAIVIRKWWFSRPFRHAYLRLDARKKDYGWVSQYWWSVEITQDKASAD
jgi:hypothetical protein